MSSFSTTLSLQNEVLNSHERFFFTKIRTYFYMKYLTTVKPPNAGFQIPILCSLSISILDIESTIFEMEMSILRPHFRNQF